MEPTKLDPEIQQIVDEEMREAAERIVKRVARIMCRRFAEEMVAALVATGEVGGLARPH